MFAEIINTRADYGSVSYINRCAQWMTSTQNSVPSIKSKIINTKREMFNFEVSPSFVRMCMCVCKPIGTTFQQDTIFYGFNQLQSIFSKRLLCVCQVVMNVVVYEELSTSQRHIGMLFRLCFISYFIHSLMVLPSSIDALLLVVVRPVYHVQFHSHGYVSQSVVVFRQWII